MARVQEEDNRRTTPGRKVQGRGQRLRAASVFSDRTTSVNCLGKKETGSATHTQVEKCPSHLLATIGQEKLDGEVLKVSLQAAMLASDLAWKRHKSPNVFRGLFQNSTLTMAAAAAFGQLVYTL